jgi:two-component system nitrate/nitrite response regulator NarL
LNRVVVTWTVTAANDLPQAGQGESMQQQKDMKQTGSRRPGSPPRVAVVAQFRLFVDSIGRCLVGRSRVLPVPLDACASIADARDAVLATKARIVVLVVSAHDSTDPVALVDELSARGRRVLVTGEVVAPETRAELLAAGAVSVTHRHHGIAELERLVLAEATRADASDAVGERAEVSTPRVRARRTADQENRRRFAQLTAAETRILWQLMQGRPVDDIAQAHVVSVATVRSQVREVLRKLGVQSQLAAVALAWSADWRPPAASAAA